MTITIPEWFLWFIVAWASVSAVLGWIHIFVLRKNNKLREKLLEEKK